MKKWFIAIVVLFAISARANTPGKHTVVLNWTASTTAGVTYNIYRGTAMGVCSGTPTPYAAGVTGTTYTDSNVTLGTTYYYNVSAVGTGGESACDGEVAVQIPSPPTPPTTLTGTVE